MTFTNEILPTNTHCVHTSPTELLFVKIQNDYCECVTAIFSHAGRVIIITRVHILHLLIIIEEKKREKKPTKRRYNMCVAQTNNVCSEVNICDTAI